MTVIPPQHVGGALLVNMQPRDPHRVPTVHQGLPMLTLVQYLRVQCASPIRTQRQRRPHAQHAQTTQAQTALQGQSSL
eukprot:COSAG06_NODE_30761_length_532_cov_13.108545_1_plen_77_part_10